MNLNEFIEKIKDLKERGFIKTKRKGDTGVGHTLEREIGLTENNISGPDLENIELKAQRRGSTSKITLFTLDKKAWKIKQKDLILKYGYIDCKGRRSLYCTVSNNPNPQGFYTTVKGDKFCLLHTTGKLIAEWKIEDLVASLSKKIPNLILVIADCKLASDGKEMFWYKEAYYLKGVDENKFIEYLKNSLITIDLRMHLKSGNRVRNHGTAFRIEEKYLADLFSSKINLLGLDIEENTSIIEIEEDRKIKGNYPILNRFIVLFL